MESFVLFCYAHLVFFFFAGLLVSKSSEEAAQVEDVAQAQVAGSIAVSSRTAMHADRVLH